MKAIYTESEKELLDIYGAIRELINSSQPYNEDARKYCSFLSSEYKKIENIILKHGQTAAKYAEAEARPEKAKWQTYYNLICPFCDTKIKQRPQGDIKMEDFLTYFLFHCDKCNKNFEGNKPNNDNDLLLWFRNLLEDLDSGDKKIVKHGKVVTYNDGEVKNFRKMFAELKPKVQNLNQATINVKEAGDGLEDVFETSATNIKLIKEHLAIGINIFGLIPKKKKPEDVGVLHDEKELYELFEYVLDWIEKSESGRTGDEGKYENFLKELSLIETTLDRNIGYREDYESAKEKMLFDHWNMVSPSACPKCKKVQESKPIGEMKNSDDNIHFFYYCKDCKVGYAGPMPNNTHDMVHFFQLFQTRTFSTSADRKKNKTLLKLSNFDIFMLKMNVRRLKKEDKRNMKKEEITNKSIAAHHIFVLKYLTKMQEIKECINKGKEFSLEIN